MEPTDDHVGTGDHILTTVMDGHDRPATNPWGSPKTRHGRPQRPTMIGNYVTVTRRDAVDTKVRSRVDATARSVLLGPHSGALAETIMVDASNAPFEGRALDSRLIERLLTHPLLLGSKSPAFVTPIAADWLPLRGQALHNLAACFLRWTSGDLVNGAAMKAALRLMLEDTGATAHFVADALGAVSPHHGPYGACVWRGILDDRLDAEAFRLSEESQAVARASIEDACRLAAISNLPAPVMVNISEEGLLSLQWVMADVSVMVVFSGDGEAGSSVKERGQYYEDITDFQIGDGLPETASVALSTPSQR